MQSQSRHFPHGVIALLLVVVAFMGTPAAKGEDGYDAWLRYRPLPAEIQQAYRTSLAGLQIEITGEHPSLLAARAELERALDGMLPGWEPQPRQGGARIVLSPETFAEHLNSPLRSPHLRAGFRVRAQQEATNGLRIMITGARPVDVLRGTFALLEHMQLHGSLDALDRSERPRLSLRMINHWDNLDGTVERGYAGGSIINWQELPELTPRYRDYARLLASLGINGVCINNVNANLPVNQKLLASDQIERLLPIARELRTYGMRLFLSPSFASPITVDGLETADPLDPEVAAWWQKKAAEIYALIPDFGGFLVKADSEGQPGPFRYGRDHAEGANMLASALEPHGGIVIWRAFVYGLKRGEDRARAAYDTFKPLDGKFASNVLVQSKEGPIDFQVREPISPLFGQMPQTNLVLELQITQEYTGQAVHLCYLAPFWKRVLDFRTYAPAPDSTVTDAITSDATLSGIAGVANTGDDRNWTGHLLAQANLYAYGRLAWDPGRRSEEIARRWTRLTFSHEPLVVDTLTSMLMRSWLIYESYTSPLGVGVMSDRETHFDPAPEIRGFYHRATKQGVGYDRTQASGSGYTQQYPAPLAERYESLATCPESLLLFFHHVPYTHRLSNGRTVIEEIYAQRWEGVWAARELRAAWQSLQQYIDAPRFNAVMDRFDQQVAHAIVWRDEVTAFFAELSGIQPELPPTTDKSDVPVNSR